MINNEIKRITYPGNGSTTVFPYTFKIFDQDDILVNLVVDSTQVTTTQTITTHYTVDGVGENNGGNITFLTAPASGITVVFTRNQPLVQDTDYTEFDAFPAETHEAAIDKCMAAIQMLSERLDRALGVPVSSSLTGIEIPIGVDRAGYFVKVNDAGTGLDAIEIDTLSGTFADVSADTSPSLGGDLDAAGYNLKVTGGSTYVVESTDNKKYFGFTKVSNAVNYFNWTNAVTSSGPILSAVGTDTNIDINFNPKGSGSLLFNGPSTTTGIGTFNTGLYVKNGNTAGAFVRMFEKSSNGSNYINLAVPDALTANYTLTLPTSAPTSTGMYLTADTSGTTSWAANKVVQRVIASESTAASTSTAIPYDGTIPQNTEGVQFMSASITPTNASNLLLIEFYCPIVDHSNSAATCLALFQDSTANALQSSACVISTTGGYAEVGQIIYSMTAGTTSATTFKIRFGPSNGAHTAYMLRTASISDIFSTACIAYLMITEYAP